MTCTKANLLLLLAALIWGVSNVAQKTILDHMGPVTVNGLKSLIAVCVIAPYYWRRLGGGSLKLAVTSGPAIMTAICFVGGTTTMQIGYGATTVVNASLLVNTATIITPAIAWMILGSRPAGVVWVAAFLAFGAIRLMGGSGFSLLGWGDAMCLVSAVCFALWFVYLGKFLQAGGDPAAITILQLTLAGMICCVAGGVIEPQEWQGLWAGLPELVVLGVLSSGVAYLLQAIAQKHTAPTAAAIIVSAEAVFGALSGAVLLGEVLTPAIVSGIALFFVAVVLVQLPSSLGIERLRHSSSGELAPASRSRIAFLNRGFGRSRRWTIGSAPDQGLSFQPTRIPGHEG
jgi:drug/metabolite transporter (DMT)-like permease